MMAPLKTAPTGPRIPSGPRAMVTSSLNPNSSAMARQYLESLSQPVLDRNRAVSLPSVLDPKGREPVMTYQAAIEAMTTQTGPQIANLKHLPDRQTTVIVYNPFGSCLIVHEGFTLKTEMTLIYFITWLQMFIDNWVNKTDHKEHLVVESVKIRYGNLEETDRYPLLRGEVTWEDNPDLIPQARGAKFVTWECSGSDLEKYWEVCRSTLQMPREEKIVIKPIFKVWTARFAGPLTHVDSLGNPRKEFGSGQKFIEIGLDDMENTEASHIQASTMQFASGDMFGIGKQATTETHRIRESSASINTSELQVGKRRTLAINTALAQSAKIRGQEEIVLTSSFGPKQDGSDTAVAETSMAKYEGGSQHGTTHLANLVYPKPIQMHTITIGGKSAEVAVPFRPPFNPNAEEKKSWAYYQKLGGTRAMWAACPLNHVPFDQDEITKILPAHGLSLLGISPTVTPPPQLKVPSWYRDKFVTIIDEDKGESFNDIEDNDEEYDDEKTITAFSPGENGKEVGRDAKARPVIITDEMRRQLNQTEAAIGFDSDDDDVFFPNVTVHPPVAVIAPITPAAKIEQEKQGKKKKRGKHHSKGTNAIQGDTHKPVRGQSQVSAAAEHSSEKTFTPHSTNTAMAVASPVAHLPFLGLGTYESPIARPGSTMNAKAPTFQRIRSDSSSIMSPSANYGSILNNDDAADRVMSPGINFGFVHGYSNPTGTPGANYGSAYNTNDFSSRFMLPSADFASLLNINDPARKVMSPGANFGSVLNVNAPSFQYTSAGPSRSDSPSKVSGFPPLVQDNSRRSRSASPIKFIPDTDIPIPKNRGYSPGRKTSPVKAHTNPKLPKGLPKFGPHNPFDPVVYGKCVEQLQKQNQGSFPGKTQPQFGRGGLMPASQGFMHRGSGFGRGRGFMAQNQFGGAFGGFGGFSRSSTPLQTHNIMNQGLSAIGHNFNNQQMADIFNQPSGVTQRGHAQAVQSQFNASAGANQGFGTQQPQPQFNPPTGPSRGFNALSAISHGSHGSTFNSNPSFYQNYFGQGPAGQSDGANDQDYNSGAGFAYTAQPFDSSDLGNYQFNNFNAMQGQGNNGNN